MTQPLTLAEATPVAGAVRAMQQRHAQLAVVTGGDGATVGSSRWKTCWRK
jgi:CBS domain-containing protein